MGFRLLRSGGRVFELMDAAPGLVGVVLIIMGVLYCLYAFVVDIPVKTAIYGPSGAEARVTGSEFTQEQEGRSIIYVGRFTFNDASGIERHVEDTYSMKNWFNVRDGHNAVVRFVKSAPDVAIELHSNEAEKPNVLWPLLITIALIGIGVMAILYGRNRDRVQEDDTDSTPRPVVSRRPTGRPLG